jgi:glycosyltransferase involved in cell wall biosynthesis
VLVPCFNQGAFLQPCLASIRAQTFASWEVLVVDDASTDGTTPGLCDAEAGPQVRVIHLPQNLGRAGARQHAVQHARGEFVARLDADDELAPDFLAATVPVFRAGVGFVYTDYQLFGSRNRRENYLPFDAARFYRRQLAPNGAVVRKAAWLGSAGHHSDFNIGNEDWDLFLALIEAGWSGVHVPRPLYRYRYHPGSWTSARDRTDVVLRSRLLLVEHHRAGFERHGALHGFLADTWRAEAERRARNGDGDGAKAAWREVLQHDPGSWRAKLGAWFF